MLCEQNTTNYMSQLCLDAWTNGIDMENCFPSSELGTITSIWSVVNGLIGFIGNLLTLLAVPFAARKKRYLKFRLLESHTKFYFNFEFSLR